MISHVTTIKKQIKQSSKYSTQTQEKQINLHMLAKIWTMFGGGYCIGLTNELAWTSQDYSEDTEASENSLLERRKKKAKID